MKAGLDGLNKNIEKLLKIAKEKQKTRDYKLLMKNISHLPENERRIAKKIKAEIMKKYNLLNM